jgi:hypothetical protein
MFSYKKLSVAYPIEDQSIEKEIDKVLMTFYDQDADNKNDSLVDYEEPPVFFDIDDDIEKAISKKVKELGKDIIMKEFNFTDEDTFSIFYIYKKNGEIIVGPNLNSPSSSEDWEDETEELQDEFMIELTKLCKKHGIKISEDDINTILWMD